MNCGAVRRLKSAQDLCFKQYLEEAKDNPPG